MNHSAIIQRAVQITRRYRALWVFGILVALTGGGGGAGSRISSDGSGGDGGELGDLGGSLDWPEGLPGRAFLEQLLGEIERQGWRLDPDPALLAGGLTLLCGGLLLLVLLAVIGNYLGRAALIRMVDHIEERGFGLGVSQGFELVWSGRTLRLFLLELLLGLFFLLLAVPLLVLATVPLFVMLSSEIPTALGLGLGIGLLLLGLPIFIALILIWRLLGQMWSREVLVAGADIGTAVSRAAGLLRQNPLPLGLMWLIMLVVYVIFGLAMLPVLVLLAIVAGAAALGVGAAVYSLASSALGAVAAGLPVFVLLIGLPLLFIAGLYSVFESSVWTLAWRELTGRPTWSATEPEALA